MARVIVENHFEDNSIFYEKLSGDLLDARAKAIKESRYTWVDNSIENRHIAPDTLIGGYIDNVPEEEVVTFKELGISERQIAEKLVSMNFLPQNFFELA